MVRAHRPDLIKRSQGEILDLRRDLSLAREITIRFAERNAAALRARCLPVTLGTLYLSREDRQGQPIPRRLHGWRSQALGRRKDARSRLRSGRMGSGKHGLCPLNRGVSPDRQRRHSWPMPTAGQEDVVMENTCAVPGRVVGSTAVQPQRFAAARSARQRSARQNSAAALKRI